MKFKITRGEFDQIFFRGVIKTYYAAFIERTPTDYDGMKVASDEWDIHKNSDGGVTITHPNKTLILKLEHGWSGQIIRPKVKKFLRFKIPKTPRKSTYRKIPGNQTFVSDGYVFTKAVRQGGFKAYRFIDKIMNDKELGQQLQNYMIKELKKLLDLP